MGRSHFLFERAQAIPEHNIIGIEWKGQWVKQARRKIEREGINNAMALWGNAWELVPRLFGLGSLQQIVLNFPDPWWKKRHHKRRIINDSFVSVLVDLLAPGGKIYFQTDVKALFVEYVQLFENEPRLKNLQGSGERLLKNPLKARSHREKKCIENGLPVYRVHLERVDK